MAIITLRGVPVHTTGDIPSVGSSLPDFTLTASDLSDRGLKDYAQKKLLLNIFPSVDTSVCAASVQKFYQELRSSDVVVLNISMDLPFAHQRFCQALSLANAEMLSAFRSSFGKDYGAELKEGPMQGLLARMVIAADRNHQIIYSGFSQDMSKEPDYTAILPLLSA